MDKTNNLDIFMTDLADSIREATGETGSINAQSFSTRITGLGIGKQDKLVSGENIKTINGESILGSGDITISGGGSSSSNAKEVVWLVDIHTIIEDMQPDIIYVATGNMSVTINSFQPSSSEVWSYNVFSAILSMGQETGDSVALILPDYVKWANGKLPTITTDLMELSINRISDGYGYDEYCAVLVPFKSV